jgi:hypothetical protein
MQPLIMNRIVGNERQKSMVVARVETKMHFSVFAKMRKSCKNGPIFAKFHKISIRKNFCENLEDADFRENLVIFSRKFLQKRKTPIFAKFFVKTKNSDFCKKICKNESYFLKNFYENKNFF